MIIPFDGPLDLASTLCIKHQRRVAKDNTVLYQQHALQLFPTPDHQGNAAVDRLCVDNMVVVQHQAMP